MIRAIQVAQYLRTKDLRGEVQLHKLLYYVQGWSLAWTGRQAFVDEIEGWQNGPVVRSLRHVWPDPDARAVPESLAMLVDSVFDFYGQYTSKELIAMTHEESPWLAAWGDKVPRPTEATRSERLRCFGSSPNRRKSAPAHRSRVPTRHRRMLISN